MGTDRDTLTCFGSNWSQPTALEELQVCVSVVQELHVVVGRRVGVLLFLSEYEQR